MCTMQYFNGVKSDRKSVRLHYIYYPYDAIYTTEI